MTYTSGKVSIEYPAIEQMEDEEKQSRINEHLKANALSILDAYEINESADTLSVSCEIISADPKRLTAVYTGELSIEGGAHPIMRSMKVQIPFLFPAKSYPPIPSVSPLYIPEN